MPRLAAAFNRSTLLTDSSQPDGENPADYYTNAITNHYARIVHATARDHRGYAFPYDDVAPTGGRRPVRRRVQRQPGPADGHPRIGALIAAGPVWQALPKLCGQSLPILRCGLYDTFRPYSEVVLRVF